MKRSVISAVRVSYAVVGLLPLVFAVACSAGAAEPPLVEYLVQYRDQVDGADSLILNSFDASIELAIPVAKSLVIRSTRPLTDLRTIPDTYTVDPIDSLNQVVNAFVFFKTSPADYTLSAVEARSAGRRVIMPTDSASHWIETAFRISALNSLATIYNVGEVDLDFPGASQTTTESRARMLRRQ